MKKTSKLLSVILAVLMLATMIPVFTLNSAAAPSANAVQFVKTGGNGNGSAPDSPLGSISSAITNLANSGGGTVVLTGPTELTGNIVFGKAIDGLVIKITSVYDDVDYREKDNGNAALVFTKKWLNVSSLCAFEYENITFRMNGQYCSFYANGYPLTMGKGVNTEFVEGFDSTLERAYPNVYGGSAYDLSATKNYPANTSVTLLSGQFWHIYGGGKGTAEKQRPSMSATIAVSPDVVVKGPHGFAAGANDAVTGEKTFIQLGAANPAFEVEASEATIKITAGANGYVQGIAPRKVKLWADSDFGAKIDDKILPNDEYEFEGNTLSVDFAESDINKAAELEASRPSFPATFPGEYIKGYDIGDGKFEFRPAGNITIAEASTIVVRLMTTEDKIKGKYTTDKAKNGDWFYDNIAYLDTYGAYDSFDNFDANRTITRGEFVKLISAFKKFAQVTNEIKFTDVPEEHKYFEAIKGATMAKLVNGYDNGDGTFSFKPDASITRAEVVTVINRIFDVADLAPIKYKALIPNFTDVDETHWAAYQIIAAAGGKEKPKEKSDLTGTGEVEHKIEGKVIFVRDDAPEDGDGSSYEKAKKWTGGGLSLPDGGTVVICGPVTFMGNFRMTNGNKNTVLYTSIYDGVDYRQTKDAALIFGKNWVNGIPGGDSIFDNMAFISRGQNTSIYCDNHKVIFGKDIVTVVEAGTPIGIYGGAAYDLSGTKNYIGSPDTSAAHTGDYFGNVTIHSGTWGNVTAGGKGSNEKPRESNGAAINVYGTAVVGGISGGSKTDKARVNGLRTIILNNYDSAVVHTDNYDIVVKVTGKADAQIIDVQQNSVSVKITAADGSKVEGVNDDGLIILDAAGAVIVTEENGKVTVKKAEKDSVGKLDDAMAQAVSEEYLKELDAMEAKRKAEIFATKTEIKPAQGRTAYYVSSSVGDDNNDGKSPEKPWKTISKVSGANLTAGDVVYFKRGDQWRNVSLTTKPGVSYTAYGEGEKPVLNRSPFDGTKHGKWTPVEGYENIYLYSETFANDIGSIAFNERTFTDIYAQKICFDFDKNKNPVSGGKIVEDPLKEMKNDLDFWHDCGGPNTTAPQGYGKLYLRSDKGNPAERFTNIEFNQKGNAIAIGGSNITIDNITVRHAGSHGIGSGTTNNLRVTNCVFEWIGGSMQNYTDGYTRFGNAVEIYGGCDGYLVDNCYINEVYDAGVTHQVSHTAAGDYVMKNVTYSNNVILRCIYSIEHFNRASAGTTRYLANILYKNNLCRYAGYCFGNTRPNKGAASHIRSGTIVDTVNFVVENNIFDRSINNLFLLQGGGDEQIQWKNNVYIHELGASYGTMKGVKVTYNSLVTQEVAKYFPNPEVNGKYLFVK